MPDRHQVWRISEDDFPRNGTNAEKLAFCVRYAILSPSTYNRQPWYFRQEEDAICLYADRRQALPVSDPDDRELIINCGSALFTLRLALRHFGFLETTEFLPDPENEDFLARVRIGNPSDHRENTEDPLFRAIPGRHYAHNAFSEQPVPEETLGRLKDAAAHEGAWIHFCAPVEKHAVSALIAEGDYIQTSSKNFRRELAAWVNPIRAMSGDGLPFPGMSFSETMASLAPKRVRRFETRSSLVATDQEIEQGSPALAVLGTRSGGVMERLTAGQALMHVLLQAESEGLSVTPLNQPCQIPELRLRLHDAISQTGRAHVILRIGYGGKPVYGPRRPLDSVLLKPGSLAVSPPPKTGGSDGKTSVSGWIRSLFLAKRKENR